MLVTGVRQRANHSANLIVDLGDKCAEALIAYDGFQALPHFSARRFVAELTHKRRKRLRIAQAGIPNCNVAFL